MINEESKKEINKKETKQANRGRKREHFSAFL